jgi:hypothetical protein
MAALCRAAAVERKPSRIGGKSPKWQVLSNPGENLPGIVAAGSADSAFRLGFAAKRGNRGRLMTTLRPAVLAFALLAAGCASQSNPFGNLSEVDATFLSAAGTWDVNKDNVVTCDEWKQYAMQLFREGDGNGDGVLVAEEYTKVARTDRLFDVAEIGFFDSNKDGKVSMAEFTERQNPAFRVLDRNSDCRIESAEFVQRREVQKVEHSVPTEMPRGGPGSR